MSGHHFLYSHDLYINFDQLVILKGEIRCLSLLGLKDVRAKNFYNTDFSRTLAAVRE